MMLSTPSEGSEALPDISAATDLDLSTCLYTSTCMQPESLYLLSCGWTPPPVCNQNHCTCSHVAGQTQEASGSATLGMIVAATLQSVTSPWHQQHMLSLGVVKTTDVNLVVGMEFW